MDHPLVATVILNTNRRADTLACLESLAHSTYERNRIIVLDNGSSDGSVEAIAADFPAVAVIRLPQNLGYAGNNNVGIAAALAEGADWVFVLNEDTVVAPVCLSQLLAAAESDSSIGILGPLVYHADEPGVIQSAGGWFDSRWRAGHAGANEDDRGQFCEPRDVAWISGCAILVRRQVVETVGALDERFFYYWEEIEWCLRARNAGCRAVHVPAAKLWHKGVARDYRPGPDVTYYNTRNRLLLLSKHHAPLAAWFDAVFQTCRTVVSWSVRPKWRDKREHRDAMIQALADFARGRYGKRKERGRRQLVR